MATSHCIVCEKTGHWAATIRRLAATLPLKQTRSLQECLDELRTAPTSFVVLEMTAANGERCGEFLVRLRDEYRHAAAVIVSTDEFAAVGWELRELGALDVVLNAHDVGRLVQLAHHHLKTAPRTPQTLREKIWNHIPWKSAAVLSHAPNGDSEQDPSHHDQ